MNDNQHRAGKTKKDRAHNAGARNAANKAERADWQNDSKHTINGFPWHTCNGKRFPTTITIRGGTARSSVQKHITYKVS